MTKHSYLIGSMFAACLSLNGIAIAADAPAAAAADAKPVEHNMMGHSPADGKAMRTMEDKTEKTHTAGQEVPHDASSDGQTHNMMGHSPADGKAMRTMEDKTEKTHTTGDNVAATGTEPCVTHNMMGHSPADGKDMAKMQDKTVPTHQSGDCKPSDTTGAAKK